MTNKYLKDKFSDISNKLKKAEEFGNNEPEIAAMLSSYLVVAIAGIFEDCVEHLFIERASKTKDDEIVSLVKALIGQTFRNPEYEKIKDLLSSLNPTYSGDLRSKIDNKNIDGLNSIVTNKNKVAHGEISNATIQDVKIYYENSKKVFKELEKILG